MPNERLRPGEPPRTIRYDERSRTLADGTVRTVVRARAYVADDRGRRVERSGSGATRKQAERALRRVLTEQIEKNDSALNGRTRLRVFADLMLTEKRELVASGDLSPGSLRTYEGNWERHLAALGEMAVAWMDVPRCDRYLRDLRSEHGYATVAGVRSVLTQVLDVAVRLGAIPAPNPVQACANIRGSGPHTVKALTAAEAVDIWQRLTDLAATPRPMASSNRCYRPTMCHPDVPDLWLWMLGTGDRLGNALAVSWPRIDLEAGTAQLGGTVIRAPGEGLRVHEGSTKGREAELDLPEQVIAMLLARQERGHDPAGLVFPDAFGGLLDPSNVSSKRLRPALKAIGYGHVSSHWCRRTLGSELDEAGLSLTDIAGRLRHADTRTTERHYTRKRALNPRAKAAIETMLATPRREACS